MQDVDNIHLEEEQQIFDLLELKHTKDMEKLNNFNYLMQTFPAASKAIKKNLNLWISEDKRTIRKCMADIMTFNNALFSKIPRDQHGFATVTILFPIKEQKWDAMRRLQTNKKRLLYFKKPNTKNSGAVTPQNIQFAKDIPIDTLIDFNNGFANCIWHEEKTPSMKLYNNNQVHCFGCGVHGDSIDVTMNLHGIDFILAVKLLNSK